MRLNKELLKVPPKENGPIPFWSWNDKLDKDLMKWQVEEMAKAGVRGYFMHARGGLKTEYLSDEWMECIKTGIEEGRRNDLEAWAYDEEGWPSGFGGGLVTALDESFHAMWMRIDKLSDIADEINPDSFIGAYSIEKDHCKQVDVKPRELNKKNAGDIYVVRCFLNPYYIDVMNPAAIKAFLECTHERYYKNFGKELKGFFTDEPRLFWNREGDIPWSTTLKGNFKDTYGYDLTGFLPMLFFDIKGFEKVRYDFWKLVSHSFVESFMKQIYDWCSEHDCSLTGHVMMEESVFSQMTGTAGVMPFYEYMHIPGMDSLRRGIASPIMPKQVGSVACQLGKKNTITESFALCGWNVHFEELKWIAEWQLVNGINLICQHLEGYTLRGLRKRDYPPSLFFQQPWWEDYSKFNSFLARIGYILSTGEVSVDILLIHPMQSGWVLFDGNKNEKIVKLDDDFIWAAEMMSGVHADYHLGDETILGKYGSVKGREFIVGKCSYKAVVLPSMVNMSGTTLKLLNEFNDNGGIILSIGDLPYLCDGIENPKLDALVKKVLKLNDDFNDLKEFLDKKLLSDISISDPKGEISDIHYQKRDFEDSSIYYMVNHSQKDSYKALITLAGERKPSLISLEDGEINEVNCTYSRGNTEVQLEFLPMQSYVLLASQGRCENSTATEPNIVSVKTQDDWTVEEMDLNSLTLDYCEYSIDGGEWNKPEAVIKLMKKLLDLKGQCDIALRFMFDIGMELSTNKEFYSVIEDAGEFEIYVNGSLVQNDCGWWKDTSFNKVDIKKQLVKGTNEIVLKRRFYQDPKVYEVLYGENVYETELNKLTYNVELESIYLLGDFGVVSKAGYTVLEREAMHTEGPFEIVDKPVAVKKGDLTTQGLCFFAGSVLLSQEVSVKIEAAARYKLKLDSFNTIIAKVYVNGNWVKNIFWAPYEADVTEFLKNGRNKVSIKLVGGNRNLFGPHHHVSGELYNVGPDSFTGKWSWVEREKEGQVATEEERKKNYWKEGYCLVKFGL